MAPSPPPPAAPANLAAASVTDDSVTLSWDDPADPSITGYRILYRAPAHAQPALAVLVNDTGTASTAYTVSGLAPGTAYEFAVIALNGTGIPSAPSQVVAVSTTGAPPAQPPPPIQPQPGAPRVCR